VIGELAAIGSAFTWAISSAILRKVADEVPSLTLNALRSAAGTGMYALAIILTGRYVLFAGVSSRGWLFIVLNLCIGMVLGDTAYYSSMRLIGLSRALTISSVYPLLTALLAGAFLGELFTWKTWAGFVLCIGGVILVARSEVRRGDPAPTRRLLRGTMMAIAAACMWAVGTICLRVGSEGLDALVVNSVRLAGVSLFAGLWARARGELACVRRFSRAQVLPILLASLIGSFGGATLYVLGVQLAGASKAAVLASVAPLVGVPMSLLAGESVNAKLLAGVVAAVVGVMLVV
jgi:drug/metabolite transporter (DMT)-like permease